MGFSKSAPSIALRWRRLAREDRSVVGVAIGLLPASAFALRHLGFRRVYAALGRAFPVREPVAGCEPSAARVVRVRELIDRIAARIPGRPGCLPRSLAVWALLRREGVPAALRIGVRRPAGSLRAHAWVESHGFGESDDGWSALPELPGSSIERLS